MINGTDHPYGYLNQEEQNELGLNWLTFRYRNYMPDIGRFFGSDPITEDFYTISNYQFAHNNPVWKIELEGLEGEETSGDDVVNKEPVQNATTPTGRTYSNQPYAKASIGFGMTFGLEVEAGPITVGASKDFGTTSTTYSTDTGTSTSYTEGYSIDTPIVSYSKQTSTNISDVTQVNNADGTVTTPAQSFETTQTTTNEVSSMGGSGVWESTQGGTYTISESTQSQHGVRPGTNTITKLTTQGSGTFTSNGTQATSTTQADIKFGVKINAGIRVEFEVGIKDIPEVKQGFGANGTTCFVKGTKVLMNDKTLKNIEDIQKGDQILSVDMNNMNIEPDLVVAIPNKLNKYKKIKAIFKNGVVNEFSPAHPFWVIDKGWCVYDLKEAKKELNFEVKQLLQGDIVYFYNNDKLIKTQIMSIEDTGEYVEMYNVEFVKNNHTFFANGILVHNKLN